MFKTIKYSDQYLAKTLFKRALLFILFLVFEYFSSVDAKTIQLVVFVANCVKYFVDWFGWLGRVLVLQELCARTFGLCFKVPENS